MGKNDGRRLLRYSFYIGGIFQIWTGIKAFLFFEIQPQLAAINTILLGCFIILVGLEWRDD